MKSKPEHYSLQRALGLAVTLMDNALQDETQRAGHRSSLCHELRTARRLIAEHKRRVDGRNA